MAKKQSPKSQKEVAATRRTTVTQEQRERFLAQLRVGMSAASAAQAAGADRRTFYRHAEVDPEFKKAWDDAYDEGTDRLEDQVVKLGVKEGNIVALIFTLKARRPEKYREGQQVNVFNNAQVAFINAIQRLEQPGAQKFIAAENKGT